MIWNFPSCERGDTFDETGFVFPFDLTGLTIEMIFFFPIGKRVYKTWTTSDVLEIDTQNSKRLKIKAHELKAPAKVDLLNPTPGK